MAINKEKLAEFQKELDELLAKHGYTFMVGPIFIDALGHKHPINVGEISAELQINEVKTGGTD